MLVAWELETQVEPICGKVSPFFGHFDKRTLFSRWGNQENAEPLSGVLFLFATAVNLVSGRLNRSFWLRK